MTNYVTKYIVKHLMYLLMVRSDVLRKTCGAKRTAVWWWLIWWWLKRFWKLLVWLVILLLSACDLGSGYGVMVMWYVVVFCKSVAVHVAEWGCDWWAVLGFRVLHASGVILEVDEEFMWFRVLGGVDESSCGYLRWGGVGLFLHPLLQHVSLWSTPLRFVCCWWT